MHSTKSRSPLVVPSDEEVGPFDAGYGYPFTVHAHTSMAPFEWASRKIKLYRHRVCSSITGLHMLAELRGKAVLNANVLEFLLCNQCLIPLRWARLAVAFWGTIYRDDDGASWARYLYAVDRKGRRVWVENVICLNRPIRIPIRGAFLD